MNTPQDIPPPEGIANQPADQAAPAGAPQRLRIVLVDDDQGTRDAVARCIAGTPDFELVGEFADPRVALRRIPKLAPDVALVDINMPNMSGIDFVAKASQTTAQTQFVMLTVYGDTNHIFQALTAGACGYLLKSTLLDDLVAAVREAHRGGSPMASDVARKVVRSFYRPNFASSPEALLSEREKVVLDKLADGFLYKEIASELGVSVATISTYVRRIYVKLQVRSRSQAVAKVRIHK